MTDVQSRDRFLCCEFPFLSIRFGIDFVIVNSLGITAQLLHYDALRHVTSRVRSTCHVRVMRRLLDLCQYVAQFHD